MTANAFERGARAKRKGRSAESNPFAKRAGRSNAKKANDWLLGWHSCEVALGAPGGSGGVFEWPRLAPLPRPLEGDYGVRERGLDALFRPRDLLEWEVLLGEMRIGRVEWVPEWARVGYAILWFYAEAQGESLGAEPAEPDRWTGHPMKYLYSVLRVHEVSQWPPLVVSAYEELYASERE